MTSDWGISKLSSTVYTKKKKRNETEEQTFLICMNIVHKARTTSLILKTVTIHGRHVTLTTLPLFVSRLSRRCGSLNLSQPYGPSWPVTGTTLFFLPSLDNQYKHKIIVFLDISIAVFFNLKHVLGTGFCLPLQVKTHSVWRETSSNNWAQMNRFLPEEGERIRSPKRLNKKTER
jgi:hypothetical protein